MNIVFLDYDGVVNTLWFKDFDLEIERGYEIKDWLKKNRNLNIEHFVILDDESSGMGGLVDHLALTDTCLGLTMYSYEEAKMILSILEV